MPWLLEEETAMRIQAAVESGDLPSLEAEEGFIQAAASGPGPMTTAGRTATIAVEGVLTEKPNLMAMIFGGGNTTYRSITAAISEAEANQNIDQIVLDINSPGGQFDGLFSVLEAISAAGKPVRAEVRNLAASAAYAIASQADEIVAHNRASRVGSIGVVADFFVWGNQVAIASTEAPEKRPDVRTEEGRAVVRKQLDAMHEIFVDVIATGRNLNSSQVNADFGRGAVLLAGEALRRGMIDAIAGVDAKTEGVVTTEGKKEMDVKTLKEEHPSVYAAVLGEGVEMGVAKERDRVEAHLILGEGAGATEIAVAAVRSGDPMTETYRAKYLAAGMIRRDQDDRLQDDKLVTAADDADAPGDDQAEDVFAILEKRMEV